ncbi:hypothetical protein CRUP_000334 [Coryphaenoides rupestris]|nr:hypothetical protein CRUP_000334 [Coryphaenoides rupestris]
MADHLSLYLTNVNVSIGPPVSSDEQTLSNAGSINKDFECVELEGVEPRDGQHEPDDGVAGAGAGAGAAGEAREKTPRRVIHFSSGETMEEYSTDEEGGDEAERKDLLAATAAANANGTVDAVRSKMTWGPYFWFHMWRAATSTISACDYLGERMASLFGITSAKYQYAIDEYNRIRKERMASLFGITSAKYQYAIDEYNRIRKEKEEEHEENRLSEEAERAFAQSQARGDGDGDGDGDGGDAPAAHLDQVTYRVEDEKTAAASTTTVAVPVVVTAT